MLSWAAELSDLRPVMTAQTPLLCFASLSQ
jgi:hypothetical protein